mgnify:CR=1 FL=1
MAVLDGADIVYVARRADRSLTTINLFVGARLPAYCTSMGRVLLAYSPVQEMRALHAGAVMVKHTAKTITDIEGLEVASKEIRTRGYCMTDQAPEIGVGSVAAPVRDPYGEVLAARNVSPLAAPVAPQDPWPGASPRPLAASAPSTCRR